MPTPPDDAFAHILSKARCLNSALLEEVQRIGPLRVETRRHNTVADHLYRSIVGQQLSSKSASTIWKRIEALARRQNRTPQQLFTEKHLDELRVVGVSAQKARSLVAVRRADVDGLLNEKQLAKLPHAERTSLLCSIWGVGQWTADMAGIFHFRDPDIWPKGDAAASATLHKWTGSMDVVATAACFAPYRSLLARYMWHSRDFPPPHTKKSDRPTRYALIVK